MFFTEKMEKDSFLVVSGRVHDFFESEFLDGVRFGRLPQNFALFFFEKIMENFF